MQFIDGPTLKAARREMTFSERLAVAVRICRALDAIHERGLVHRDVNPRNVVLRRTALDGWWPYVIDFGIAHETPMRRPAGRPAGAGHGLVHGARADARRPLADRPAHRRLQPGRHPLRAVLRAAAVRRRSSEAILTKALHEDPAPFAAVAPTLPDRLGEIVGRCLDKAPENRYATARALAADLEDCDRLFIRVLLSFRTSVPP